MIHVRAIIDVRDAPLLYVIRDLEIVPSATPLAMDQPHSVEHGTLVDELITRTSHSHPLFRYREVCDLLETSRHVTNYSATMVQFRKAQDGRSAYVSLVSQHDGDDVWQETISGADDYLKNGTLSGTNSIPLSSHIYKHRKS